MLFTQTVKTKLIGRVRVPMVETNMWGTTGSTPLKPLWKWDPWNGLTWPSDRSSSTITMSVDAFMDSSISEETAKEVALRRVAAHCAALEASRKLASELHPERCVGPKPEQPSTPTSQSFHWMSQRKRCCRVRAPIRGYDRA